MKKINFLLICALLAICACSEDEVLITQEEQPFTAEVDSSFFRSESDAVFSAMKTFSELYPNDKRVSHRSKTLIVKNVNRIKSNNQSSLNAPGFYIVNFEDGGFVMVSNDTRATEVYAYSDEGSLSQGANDGVDYFLESANDYLNYEIENSNMINEYLPITPVPDPDDPSNFALVYHGGHYCHQVPVSETTSGSLEYLLSSKWHQKKPYNNLCLNSSGGTVSAGCIAIALGQIMAYHQKPASYNGHTYSWDLITQYPNLTIWDKGSQSVAELINDIGIAAGINYTSGDNSAYISDAYNALDDFGYNRSLSDYSFSTIASNIDLNRPCYIRGDNNTVGHAWVIDGYRSKSTTYKYYHQTTLESCYTETITKNYVHCNWGWSGEYNGFYLSAVFNNYDYPPIYDETPNSDTTFNLSNNLKMIYNIYQ